MSGLDNHFSEIVQNLLTNVTVGRDINIDTIQQIAQQIIIQITDNHNSNQGLILITTQVLELFKTENQNIKKAIVLQLLRTCQYNEDLPIKLREEANNLYAEFESLSPAHFKDLFTHSGKQNYLNHKLTLFLLGIFTGVSAHKLKKMWNSWFLVDYYDINTHEAILTSDENLPIEKIQKLINKDYNVSNLLDNPGISETEESKLHDNNKHKNISFNADHKPIFGFNNNINNELTYKELMLVKLLQESHFTNEIDIQELPHFKGELLENLLEMEVQESIIRLEEIEKIIIDGDIDFGEYSSDHEYHTYGEEHNLDDGDYF